MTVMWKHYCKPFLRIPYLIGPFGISNNVNLNCATYSPVVKQKCSTNFECHWQEKKRQKIRRLRPKEKWQRIAGKQRNYFGWERSSTLQHWDNNVCALCDTKRINVDDADCIFICLMMTPKFANNNNTYLTINLY